MEKSNIDKKVFEELYDELRKAVVAYCGNQDNYRPNFDPLLGRFTYLPEKQIVKEKGNLRLQLHIDMGGCTVKLFVRKEYSETEWYRSSAYANECYILEEYCHDYSVIMFGRFNGIQERI